MQPGCSSMTAYMQSQTFETELRKRRSGFRKIKHVTALSVLVFVLSCVPAFFPSLFELHHIFFFYSPHSLSKPSLILPSYIVIMQQVPLLCLRITVLMTSSNQPIMTCNLTTRCVGSLTVCKQLCNLIASFSTIGHVTSHRTTYSQMQTMPA